MRVGTATYVWNRPAAEGPALLRAAELLHRRTQPSGELRHQLWVLDYNYTPGERVRVHSPRAPWVERPAQVAHLYAPGVSYWEDQGPEAAPLLVHCAYLQFADGGLLGLPALLPVSVRYARFFDDEGLVGRLLSEIMRIAATEQEAGYWAAYARCFQILTHLRQADPLGGSDYRIRGERPSPSAPDFVEHLRRYIHAHLADRITVADLARAVDMSVSALAHRYPAVTGETPMAAVRRARLDLAKGLLAKGYRLREVAGQVGFTDEFHLSRTFKQVEGVSPGAYRRAALTGEEEG
jgi:AraC-like DNA-binding protein